MSSLPSDTFAEKLSNLLLQSWDPEATGLQVSDVLWSHDKFETMISLEQASQKAIVSTYNPANPVTIEVLSPQTNFVHEIVVVDVILHTEVLGGTDACIAVRESIRKLVLAGIHGIQVHTSDSLEVADSIAVEGEFIRGELPQLQREAFKIVVNYFEVAPL